MSYIVGEIVLKGAKDAFSSPGLVLITTFFAFGALANSIGANLLTALGLTAFVFAIPGQVVLLDEVSRNSSLVAVFIATSLTAIRLFPLTMSLMPVMRTKNTPRWLVYLLAHFIAVTVWVQSMIALPKIQKECRISYCLGLCMCLLALTSIATILGFLAASHLPSNINAALLMVTPIYFFLSLFFTAKSKQDQYAFLFGAILGGAFMFIVPEFALIAAGFIGGTIAYFLERSGDSNND